MTVRDLLMIATDTLAGPELESARYWHARSIVLAKAIRELFDREEPDCAEAWQSEDLGKIVFAFGIAFRQITPAQARDIGAALYIAADRAAAEVPT